MFGLLIQPPHLMYGDARVLIARAYLPAMQKLNRERWHGLYPEPMMTHKLLSKVIR